MDILIIEDEFLLGVLLADALTDAGHRVRGPASCRAEAIALLADQLPQLAFVDIELRGGDSGIELATELKRRGVPCVFATGQPERAREHRAQALGLIAKPYHPMSLSEAARYFEARLAGGPPPRAPRTPQLFEIDPPPAPRGGADRAGPPGHPLPNAR